MGSSGKSGGGSGGWDPVSGNMQSGYAAFQPGQTAAGSIHPYFGSTVDPSHPDFKYYQQGWDRAQQEYNTQQAQQSMFHDLFSGFAPPEPYKPPEINWRNREDASFDTVKGLLGGIPDDNATGMYGFTGGKWQIIDNSAVPEDMQHGFSRKGEDYASGVSARDQMFGDYTDAAGAAVDYVNNQIANERSNAALLGVKYDITPEQKSQRINDYFATLWTDSQQADLEKSMETWGNPAGFANFDITRGDASTQNTGSGGNVTTSVSSGQKPKKSPLEEDELEKSKSVLGD